MRYKVLALWIVAFALSACSGATNTGTPVGVGVFEQAPCPIELPDEMVLVISTPENKGDLYTYIFEPILNAFEVRR